MQVKDVMAYEIAQYSPACRGVGRPGDELMGIPAGVADHLCPSAKVPGYDAPIKLWVELNAKTGWRKT